MDALVAVLDERFDLEGYRRCDRVPTVDDRMLAEQDDFAVADTHRGFFGALSSRTRRGALALILHFRDELLCLPYFDDAALDQSLEHFVENFLRRAGSRDDAARVQRHVAFLDAFRRERANGGEILRETCCPHHLRELRCRLDAK